jgi:rod shape-determining protein MreD
MAQQRPPPWAPLYLALAGVEPAVASIRRTLATDGGGFLPLTLPISALGALIAALIDTTVLPEWVIAGAVGNLVLVFAVVAAVLLSVEDGFVWAVVGGLVTDALTGGRPLGATTLTLLLVVGVAIAGTHLVGQRHRWTAVAAVFLLTWAYQVLLLLVLAMAEGVSIGTLQLRPMLISAIINSVIAVPVSVGIGALAQRFAVAGRSDW